MSGDGKVEILWDDDIAPVNQVRHNRPDITIKRAEEKKWTFVDVSIPMDHRVAIKEDEKVEKYIDLVAHVKNEHNVKTDIIPIVIGAMGTVPKRLEKYLKELEIPDIIGSAQMSVLIGTARILRNVLSL